MICGGFFVNGSISFHIYQIVHYKKKEKKITIVGPVILLLFACTNAPGGIIYEFLGKWADKRRTKNFPEEAIPFLFGKEALDQILAEYKFIEEEKKKTVLYEQLTRLGLNTSKDNFEQIYDEMR